MGTSHSYKCKQCDKNIVASLHETEGMLSKVQAMKCNDCNEVSDCTIATKNSLSGEFNNIIPICECCESQDIVQWDNLCPKCNSAMDDNGLFMLWD